MEQTGQSWRPSVTLEGAELEVRGVGMRVRGHPPWTSLAQGKARAGQGG